MTDTATDLTEDLFHGCAWVAFVEQARCERGWPDREATRKRAYRLYEDALAEKNRRPTSPAADVIPLVSADVARPEV